MTTPHIPQHRLDEKFQGEMIVLWHIVGGEQEKSIDYAHRDDYYMFMFLEKGYAKFAIDFEEYEVNGPAVIIILPEQVHLLIEQRRINCWALVVDKIFVPDRCKALFRSASTRGGLKQKQSPNQINDLKLCLSILNRRLNEEEPLGNQEITRSLLTSCIEIIAESYHTEAGNEVSKQSAIITSRFRTLLSENYRQMKKPSQYAKALNISSIYLNEIIKKSTGITVSASIHNEVVVQAKRLLFYTNLSVKEIALLLGYEDWAYFTRLFTKTAALTPSQFREKYLK